MNNNTTVHGPGFTTLLTLLFIGLKLGGVIKWSWLWVLSPIWISCLIVLVVFLIALGIYVRQNA